MVLVNEVDYVATNDRLQVIPWVKVQNDSGQAWIYRSDGQPNDAPPPAGQARNLDCMDCHNRTAHTSSSMH